MYIHRERYDLYPFLMAYYLFLSAFAANTKCHVIRRSINWMGIYIGVGTYNNHKRPSILDKAQTYSTKPQHT